METHSIIGIVDTESYTSAARLRGFEEDLGLVGNQFATVLSILYVGYITMQVPSYASFCDLGRTSIDSCPQEHVPQSYRKTIHISPCLHGSVGPYLCLDWSYPQLRWRSPDAFLPGHLRVRILPSKLPLANVLRMFSWSGRGPCSSFRNGTNAVNLVCELLFSHAASC